MSISNEDIERTPEDDHGGGTVAIKIPDSRTLPDEVLEALRVRALRAKEMGHSIAEIAKLLGVARETVSRWWNAYERGGTEALPGPRTGRPVGSGRKLTPEQEDEIVDAIVGHRPDELEIPSALWTRAAVQELIQRRCGIVLSVRTVGDYLKRWGLTPQKPIRKSYRQDPEEVARWIEEEYPALEARAAVEDAEIHWGDETGVRSTTHVGRGYAVPQSPPELSHSGSRFSINMISTVTNDGQLRWMVYEGMMNGPLFIQFLTRLIHGSEQKIFLIVDRLSAHESEEVQVWLYEHRDRIEVFGLPRYSPELNPDEYLNGDVKQEVNKEGLPNGRDDLKQKVQRVMAMFANLPQRIANYFQNPCIKYASAGE